MREKFGMFQELADHVLTRVVKDEGGCWNSQWSDNGRGYTAVKHEGRTCYCHRVTYEAFVGAIPEGLHIDHTCGNRRCVNPSHLEPVTPAENNRRANERSPLKHVRRTTHCINGHLKPPPGSPGRRNCAECRKARQACRVPENIC